MFSLPLSAIVSGPSLSGKSTLVCDLIKNSERLFKSRKPFDFVAILYRSMQPLYQDLKATLSCPVVLYENSLPEEFYEHIKNASQPILLVDDGITPQNQEIVVDFFSRLGHHLGVSIILICQSLFDSKNQALRLCHRNTKLLIVFSCPRDQGSLRTLIYQMIPSKKKATTLLNEMEKIFEQAYAYVCFDFHPLCLANERIKLDILNTPRALKFISTE